MIKKIQTLLGPLPTLGRNTYFAPDIPNRKLSNASASMGVPESKIKILFDDTLFGGASDGFVTTTNQFVFKEFVQEPIWFHLSDIKKIRKKSNADKIFLETLSGEKVELGGLKFCDYPELSKLLNCAVKILRNKAIARKEASKTAGQKNKKDTSGKVNRNSSKPKQEDDSQEDKKVSVLGKKTIQAISGHRNAFLANPDEFVVAVVAPMSSGKSTVLNAMLGTPLLPSRNEACTAIPMKITDIDGMESFRARKVGHDRTVSEWTDLAIDIGRLQDWNSEQHAFIEIQGDFPNIINVENRIAFLDTPGPNNAANLAHAQITHQILSDAGYTFLLFVLNATQSGTEDERKLLVSIREIMEAESHHAKLVFVVSKIDALDIEKNECPIRHIASIRSYLEGIGFEEPNVIPVMAKMSLELRCCIEAAKRGLPIPFSPRAQRRLAHEIENTLLFRDVYRAAFKHASGGAPLCATNDTEHSNAIRVAERDFSLPEAMEALVLSGIPALEGYLQSHLNEHGAGKSARAQQSQI